MMISINEEDPLVVGKDSLSHNVEFEMDDDDDCSSLLKSAFVEQLKRDETVENKSELSRYLLESIEANTECESFNILNWWKKNAYKFPCLSLMAKEVLAVSVSTIASESAFSTSGRIVDPYRSSLSPKTVEALVCTQNWLRSAEAPIDLKELLDDVGKYEEIAKGIYLLPS